MGTPLSRRLKSTSNAMSKLGMSSSAVYFRGNQTGVPVRNLQNYGFRNLRIVESVCSRTRKKKSIAGHVDSLRTRARRRYGQSRQSSG